MREQAVVALRPFQFGQIEEEGDDGEDEEAFLKEDRVRTGLIGAMTSDSQPHVRQAALAAVTKTVKIIDEASSPPSVAPRAQVWTGDLLFSLRLQCFAFHD